MARLIVLSLLAASISIQVLASTIMHTKRDSPVLVGCFSSSKPLSNQGTYEYQSSGYCSGICTSRNQGVVGLSDANVCWCGDELPAASTKVLDARCNTPCQGYGIEDCGGGTFYFTIWLTGLEDNVPSYNASASSATTSTTTKPTSSTSTTVATTKNHKATSTPDSTSSESSSDSHGPSETTIAIIIGTVIGIVALVVMAMVFCCLWRRKKTTGSFLRRQPSALLSSTTSWASLAPDATILVSAGSREWEGRISAITLPRRSSQPMSMVQYRRDRPDSDENPLCTPQDRGSSTYSSRDGVNEEDFGVGAAAESDNSTKRQVSDLVQDAHPRDSPIPFSLQLGSPTSIDVLPEHRKSHRQSNALAVSQAEEAADVVSPIPPTKRLSRVRSISMVHYPSWSEVSDFDFAGNGGGSSERKSVSGWHPWRERKDGRYELA